jgi:hypothetical protein
VKKGRKLEPNNLKGTKLGASSWESGPESGSHWELREESSRCSGLLRAAQAFNISCLRSYEYAIHIFKGWGKTEGGLISGAAKNLHLMSASFGRFISVFISYLDHFKHVIFISYDRLQDCAHIYLLRLFFPSPVILEGVEDRK